jgi:haloalkane dehalogenase
MATTLHDDLHWTDLGDVRIAYRRVGSGPDLVLLHGYPVHGLTWRKVLPELSRRFTCWIPDLPGLGRTAWRDDVDFTFSGQARTLRRWLDACGLGRVALMAHDTGGTVARCLALLDPSRVDWMVLIDTEIPHHRPPFIPFFVQTSGLPGSAQVFGALLRIGALRRSSLVLGGMFADRRLLDGEFHALFIEPLLRDPGALAGAVRYLGGVEWPVLDAMREGHARITAPVLLLWGEADTIFPVADARPMTAQFPDARFVSIPGAALMPHEERPEAVLAAVEAFLGSATRAVAAPR